LARRRVPTLTPRGAAPAENRLVMAAPGRRRVSARTTPPPFLRTPRALAPLLRPQHLRVLQAVARLLQGRLALETFVALAGGQAVQATAIGVVHRNPGLSIIWHHASDPTVRLLHSMPIAPMQLQLQQQLHRRRQQQWPWSLAQSWQAAEALLVAWHVGDRLSIADWSKRSHRPLRRLRRARDRQDRQARENWGAESVSFVAEDNVI